MNFVDKLRELTNLLTLQRTAELIDVTVPTAYRWAQKGILPAKNIGGRGRAADWRVDPNELADWYETRPMSAEVCISAVAKDQLGVAHEHDDGTVTLCERHPAFPDVIYDDRGEACEV